MKNKSTNKQQKVSASSNDIEESNDKTYKEYPWVTELKKYTVLLYRFEKLKMFKYDNLMELMEVSPYRPFRLTDCRYEDEPYVEDEDLETEYKESEITKKTKAFYNAIDSFLQSKGYPIDENAPLVFESPKEESFFSTLPDDEDLLSSAIYFFLASPEDQLSIYSILIDSFVYSYRQLQDKNLKKKEKTLLNEFRSVSKQKQSKILEYAHYLFLTEQIQKNPFHSINQQE